jgi:hypothetical protein
MPLNDKQIIAISNLRRYIIALDKYAKMLDFLKKEIVTRNFGIFAGFMV